MAVVPNSDRPDALADTPPPSGAGADKAAPERFLVFETGSGDDSRYACPTTSLAEVMSYPDILAIPRTKPWFLGVCAHRGHLISVNDLRCYLLGEEVSAASYSRVLLFEDAEFLYGFAVSSVAGFGSFVYESPAKDGGQEAASGVSAALSPIRPAGGDAETEAGKPHFAVDFKRIIASREFHRPGLGQDE